MNSGPIPYIWNDGSLTPKNHYWLAQAEERFTEGKSYTMDEWQERSRASHNQFFAAIHDAWLNLPELETERFPTDEHLRKYALIKVGYRDERTIVAASKAEAQRLATFVKPMDEYAIVTVKEAVIVVYTAKSQSMKAMGKDAFQKSKQDVLDILESMVGVKPGLQLTAPAEKGASA